MNLNQVFNELDDMMRRADIDKVIPYLEGKCKEAEEEGDGGSLVSILNELVGFCRETCQYEKAMEYAASALQVIEQIGLNDTVHHATTFLNIANCLRAAGRLTDSLNTYHKVEAMYHRMLSDKDFGFASLYNNESLLYQETGDYNSAYECLKKALSIVREYPDKEWELAVTYANLANTCLQLKTPDINSNDYSLEGNINVSNTEGEVFEDKIMEYADNSISLFHKLNETDTHIAAALTAKGQLMERKGKYTEAIECYEEALTAIKTTLGETDFFRRVLDYLKVSVRRSGKEYSGIYKGYLSDNRESFTGGLELNRDYYNTVGKPMLLEKYSDIFTKLTIGMIGEGSDCFGFDDQLSMDHDWGPGFYIWLEDDLYKSVGDRLEKDYELLPQEFMGHKRINTVHGKRRVGVCSVGDFCRYYLGDIAYEQWITKGHISSDNMLSIPMYRLAAFCNGEIFEAGDDSTLCKLRDYINNYYDASAATRLLCQALAEFGQNAQYNYPRMKKRGDNTVAMQLLFRGLNKALIAAYILNRQYAPHDKWLMKGTGKFTVLKDLPKLISDISVKAAKTYIEDIEGASKDIKDKDIQTVEVLVEQLANMLLTEALKQNYIGNAKLISVSGKSGLFIDSYLEHYTSDMMFRAKYLTMSHDELVEDIARMEFAAFDLVKNEGGRAECQDDWYTFHIMRASQYTTWTDEMLVQYAVDFSLAMESGWNPIMEKYGRMEESTSPKEWDEIKDRFPVIPPEKKQIMEEIIKIQVGWMEQFAKEYPGLASHARRIHTSEDMPWDTSYETYLRGEMGTYSDKMLKLYGQFIVGIVKEGDNLAYRIMNETVHMYGYSSFEEAMNKI